MVDYRGLAEKHIQSADDHIKKNDTAYLRYAALELRLAMEIITYERVIAYKKDFPIEGYEKWQPRHLMKELIKIDPQTDQNSALYIGEEEIYGQGSNDMSFIGEENVLGIDLLKKHYDALGSYVHHLSPKKLVAGEIFESNKLKKRCEFLIEELNKVINSSMRNIISGVYINHSCQKCETKMRLRIDRITHSEHDSIIINCWNNDCNASYKISKSSEKEVSIINDQMKIICLNLDCKAENFLWKRSVKLGNGWVCDDCEQPHKFSIGHVVIE